MSSAAVTGTAPLPQSREVELSILGMTCAACAARVEKKLSEIPDVTAAVNYATGSAIVTAPSAVSLEVLVDAVEQAGYAAEAAGSPAGTEDAPGARCPHEPPGRSGARAQAAADRRRTDRGPLCTSPCMQRSTIAPGSRSGCRDKPVHPETGRPGARSLAA